MKSKIFSISLIAIAIFTMQYVETTANSIVATCGDTCNYGQFVVEEKGYWTDWCNSFPKDCK